MRTFRALLLGASFAACSVAQDPATGTQHPAPVDPAVQNEYQTGGENEWFEATQLDLGTYFEEEDAVGVFKFKNPRGELHKISGLQPSCACSKATVRIGDRHYEIGADKQMYKVTKASEVESRERVTHINVGPGESGEVEVHMTMTGIRGPKDANLTVHTDDPDLALINLRWRAVGATYFVVDPPDVNLSEMSWEDQREFQFRITSPLRPDFNLVSHEPLPEAMKVEYEKQMEGDAAVWIVKGTYGPGANERDGGGVITFKTDVDDKTVTARVIAFLKGPLTLKPGGFVSLGHIPKGEGKSVEVTLTPGGSFDLQVEDLVVKRLRGVKAGQEDLIQFNHRKDGKDLIVEIKVLAGMDPTYLNGILEIHLNHPASKVKEVMFNGFVR